MANQKASALHVLMTASFVIKLFRNSTDVLFQVNFQNKTTKCVYLSHDTFYGFQDHNNTERLIMVKLADSCMIIRPPKHQQQNKQAMCRSDQENPSPVSYSFTLARNRMLIDSPVLCGGTPPANNRSQSNIVDLVRTHEQQPVTVNNSSTTANSAINTIVCSQQTQHSNGFFNGVPPSDHNQIVPAHKHPVSNQYIDYNFSVCKQNKQSVNQICKNAY